LFFREEESQHLALLSDLLKKPISLQWKRCTTQEQCGIISM